MRAISEKGSCERVRPLIGLAYRSHLAGWIASKPRDVGCLELVAEHFYDGRQLLDRLRSDYPLLVHGLSLSLGTPGPLDAQTLDRFAEVCLAVDPLWVSEHIAFTRTEHVDLGYLNPVPSTAEMVRIIADHSREVSAMPQADRP